MTHKSTRTEPWRKVAKASLVQVVGAQRGSLSKQWELQLECGHIEHRKVLYNKPNLPEWAPTYKSIFQNRPDSDAKPPPDRVRCPKCDAE